MQNKKILVTGSSGTVGTRLCEILLEKGYDVIGVDYRPNEWNKKVQEITIDLDLRNKEDVLNKLPKNVDLVIHFAANARVYNLVMEPSLARDNFETLFNILEFTRINNVKKIMFSSSREVYGNSNKIIYKEDEAYVKNCESPYAASKMCGEALINSYKKCYGINFVIFRFSNIYGMYDKSDRVIPLFIKLCKDNKDLIVYGKEKILDFTYIDDAISGVVKCIQNYDNVKNDVFNISSGKGTSMIELAHLIQKHMNCKNEIVIKENREGEVVKFVADISKAKQKLNYEPQTTIDEGIKKTVRWYTKELYRE